MSLPLMVWLAVAGMLAGVSATPALAQSSRMDTSEVDPAIFRIDEVKYLGAKPDPSLSFRDESGKAFTFGEMTGQPLVLVMSYFTCDGTCELVNRDLADLLAGVKRVLPGTDYRILTVSFDTNDTLESMASFRSKLKAPAPALAAWRFSVPATGDEARRLADTIGFKYFWSPRDRVFLHPGVFAFFSAEGRVVRYLYAMNSRPFDVEMALIDAKENQIRPGQIVDFALSLCYSYNYAEGQYTINYTFIIGFGSLVFGIGALFFSILAFRGRARQGKGEVNG
ncbi:MAG: SCO family protein [Rhodospirillaceae bacterium]